ncbi:hypothetical protein L248_2284 [Schleiferilactobacillus shenzhenensis LY-73]|uniref:YkuJ n=2 Tax=Schleiferilactobacillus shenzhenensis TaxID=1231337 RepID=U4THQ2_9LACO|nr:hypothetical protein L248_2284 [Schleiferilactobacillus shenzhenensis LY-73]
MGMESSQLVAIINRLDAMIKEDGQEERTRRFEIDGTEKCAVTYDPTSDSFTLEEFDAHQSFQFDNIDLVAMEIYDLLYD